MEEHGGAVVGEVRSFFDQGVLGKFVIIDCVLVEALHSFGPAEIASVGSFLQQSLLAELAISY